MTKATNNNGKIKKEGLGLFANKTILFVFTILLIYTVFFTSNDNYFVDKAVCAVLLLSLVVICLKTSFKNNIIKVITPVSAAILFYVVTYAVSTTYAVSGKFALSELCKIVSAFAVFIIMSIQMKKDSKNYIRILNITVIFTSILGILSIDAASVKILSAPFIFIISMLNPDAAVNYGAFETGSRITSILGAPNVFAPIMALGMFIGIYLILSSVEKTQKKIAAFCLLVSSVAFVLSFSLGTMLIFVPCVLVMFFFLPNEKKAQGLMIIISCAVIAFICTFICFLGLSNKSLSFLPVTACVAFSLFYAWLIIYLSRFNERLQNYNYKKLIIVLLVVIVLITAFFAAAFSFTKGYDLGASQSVRRGFYPDAGKYTLKGNVTGKLQINITTQSDVQTMTHEDTSILSTTVGSDGSVSDLNVDFDVKEGTKVAYMVISSLDKGAFVNNITIEKAGKVENIPLKYILLPDFIVNRLQGLWANENAIQRFVFFKDGLKLYASSPILGIGPGGFESQIMSVQDFYYQTKYAHNHYIQILLESGILGLLAFISIGFCCLWVLFKKRKINEQTMLAFAPFLACILLMYGHAAIEVDFSTSIYIIFAFLILAVISHIFELELYRTNIKAAQRKMSSTISKTAIVLSAVYIMIIAGNLYAIQLAKNSQDKLSTMQTAMLIDPFNAADYKLSYIMNSITVNDKDVRKTASGYAQSFENSRSNTALSYVTQYYFSLNDIDKGFEMSRKHLINTRSSTDSWQKQFDLYKKLCTQKYLLSSKDTNKTIEVITDNIIKTEQLLNETNKSLIIPVTLNEKSAELIKSAHAVADNGYDLETAVITLFI